MSHTLEFPLDYAVRARLATESFHHAFAEFCAKRGGEIDFRELSREDQHIVLHHARSLLDGARAIVTQAADLRARRRG